MWYNKVVETFAVQVLVETAASCMFADRLAACVPAAPDRRPWTRTRIDTAGRLERRARRARALRGRLAAAVAALRRDVSPPVTLRAWQARRVYGSRAQLQLDFERAERYAERRAELIEQLGSCYNLPRKALRAIVNN
jgi:hypothetical protein